MKKKKIGILGGGQLALMMLPSIKDLGLESIILDASGSSCDGLADQFINGNFKKKEDCLKLADCDFVTFEIESISPEGYAALAEKTKVHPSPKVLEVSQDKGKQKTFFLENGIPSSDFEILSPIGNENFEQKVVKICRGGYDGYGVWVSGGSKEFPESFKKQPCVVEDRVELEKEISLVCCRSIDGKIEYYELVEMVMDPKLNLLDYQINPAQINEDIQIKAKEYAKKIVEGLGHVGVLAVEFFITKDKSLLVNEIAPRVHNSGHNTIESAPTSQFKNHVLAISEQTLGTTLPAKASLTMNLIGEGEKGEAEIHNEINDEDVFIHLYNKKESRPGRKMGHLTLLGSVEELKEKVSTIKSKIRITGRSS